ncbi:MAG TPA: cytochrome c, partial [Thiomicrorhabdus sp.]|nr:cytochrome c [Thiomicrorhabdus sp.]
MLKKMSFIIASTALLAACSGTNDYTPAAGATGQSMYTASCASCHN